jgi:hypothetical protein
VSLIAITLLANHVGIIMQDDSYIQDETLCAPLGLDLWYIALTGVVIIRLLLTMARYY